MLRVVLGYWRSGSICTCSGAGRVLDSVIRSVSLNLTCIRRHIHLQGAQ